MEITVNIKCPDLALAASALAKAIMGANAPAMLTPQIDMGPAEVAATVQTLPGTYPTPAPVAAPTQATVAPQAPTSAATAPSPAVPVTAGPAQSPATITPSAAMTAPTAPGAVPTTPAPGITGDMVAKAGADLIAANPQAMGPLNALLQKYGVGCAQELRPDQIGPFATEMRGLGAKI